MNVGYYDSLNLLLHLVPPFCCYQGSRRHDSTRKRLALRRVFRRYSPTPFPAPAVPRESPNSSLQDWLRSSGKKRYVSLPGNPLLSSSVGSRRFSLLHWTILPQYGHRAVLPINVEISKDSMSPKEIGHWNQVSQPEHLISMNLTLPMTTLPILMP